MTTLQGMINRQKALAEQHYNLAKETQSYYDAWEADYSKRVYLALEELKELKEWTLVSEGYPEEEVDVLVCNKEGDLEISRGSYSTEEKDCWIWYTSGWKFGEVVAWKPLPKPYEPYSYGKSLIKMLNRFIGVTEERNEE